MKVTILGSGTSTGIPMVGCRCRICRSTDPRDQRTRSSILLERDGNFILVDTTTDFRQQALRAGLPRVDAVLFTHAHADHVNGIDDLRGFHFIHKRVIPCYGSEATMRDLTARFGYVFSPASPGYAQLLEPHVVTGDFPLFGLVVRPLTLPHGDGEATGFRIGPFAYLTDCSSVPADTLGELAGLDLLIIDALRYTPHPNHLNIDAALDLISALKPARALLTHLTHEVSWADGGRLPRGVELAFDGMTLSVAF